MMGLKISLAVVVLLVFGVFLGIELGKWYFLFGIVIPYAAMTIFVVGVIYRVVKWGRAPVPFCIPTTCGQQQSLPWIKTNKLDNPSSNAGVLGRMMLEALLFRSLFRNTRCELTVDNRMIYSWEKWLWLAGLLFHWSLLMVIMRHLRFFAEPVPLFLHFIEGVDGFFQVGLQGIYLTGVTLLIGITFLLLRRVMIPQVRYVSLPADYFPLLVMGSIALTGIIMRYFIRVDVAAIKELALGLVTFSPVVPQGIGVLFYMHLFLVSLLFAYFPFSKLMHMAGIFLSPTRNLPNDSRAKRHVNPWDYPVPVHSYEEYEEEFREKMKGVGLPLERCRLK
jgi:nitrate reductase gamma subunit